MLLSSGDVEEGAGMASSDGLARGWHQQGSHKGIREVSGSSCLIHAGVKPQRGTDDLTAWLL